MIVFMQDVAGSSSSFQPMILSSDMGVVEEEVTTEIIKTEITTDENSQQFFIKNEAVEYEDGIDMKKVFVTKVQLQLNVIESNLTELFFSQTLSSSP